jgi:hypothetical protein
MTTTISFVYPRVSAVSLSSLKLFASYSAERVALYTGAVQTLRESNEYNNVNQCTNEINIFLKKSFPPFKYIIRQLLYTPYA